jgi:hypothetical protein
MKETALTAEVTQSRVRNDTMTTNDLGWRIGGNEMCNRIHDLENEQNIPYVGFSALLCLQNLQD